MASVPAALRHLRRYVLHMQRYLIEYYENLRLEASYGMGEDPEWYLSEQSRTEFEQNRRLYGEVLEALVREAGRLTKPQLLGWIKWRERHLGRTDMNPLGHEDDSTPAERELLNLLRDLLKGRLYVPASYERWNNIRFNRWYHDPYIPDPESEGWNHYWITAQTKLVLFDDLLQLRWGSGRVLFERRYQDIVGVERFWRKRKEHWRFTFLQGDNLTMNVDWVGNLTDLRRDLTHRLKPELADGLGV